MTAEIEEVEKVEGCAHEELDAGLPSYSSTVKKTLVKVFCESCRRFVEVWAETDPPITGRGRMTSTRRTAEGLLSGSIYEEQEDSAEPWKIIWTGEVQPSFIEYC